MGYVLNHLVVCDVGKKWRIRMAQTGVSPIRFNVSVEGVRGGVGAFFTGAKDWSQWLGRKLFVVANDGLQLGKTGLYKCLELLKILWESTKPLVKVAIDFLKSSAGIVTLLLTGGLLLGHTALKLEDQMAQRMLLGLSYLVFGVGLVFGCQVGVFPNTFV
jgi:hypothetical protein